MCTSLLCRAALLAAATLISSALAAQETRPAIPTASAEVVVSATKLPENPIEVAGSVETISGDVLRRTGARTVGEALLDVVGLDSGGGSDNGPRLPNIGMWGLKEFDALLITVDGVPVGGPFNPSLSQIPLEDIERIEIVKGPQGTLYGVSAFAGMIQVFTKRKEAPGGSATLGGGSFGEKRAGISWGGEVGTGLSLRVFGSMARLNGYQDRTEGSTDRLLISGEKSWGAGSTLGFTLTTYRDTNHFGSPLPVDAGQPVPGFSLDRNYAIDGARLDHRVVALSTDLSIPIANGWKLQNTLGIARDDQNSVRSYIVSSSETEATATGVALTPVESTFFDDLRLVGEFDASGRHRLVGGAAITWGRTSASGTGFDFDLTLLPFPVVPSIDQVPVGDHRSYEDRRTFLGFYLNDEWTPFPRLTLTAGARYDATSETLNVSMQEVGTPAPDTAADSHSDGQFSGGVSALYRLASGPKGPLSVANVYVSLRSAFKPAAPNLSEAEGATILEPERTRSGELGLKTRWFGDQLAVNLSMFHMDFENMVVSTVGPDGNPQLVNAGEERFQGTEIDATWHTPFLEGLAFSAGYAHHDATFVTFSFFTPEGDLRVVDGKRLELSPRDMWNVRLLWAPKTGLGGFVSLRHQNQRPLTRRNTFYTDSFDEWDAGLTFDFTWGHINLYGRNLGDSRHYVADSEIGDGQFYVAPPARFGAELTVRF